MVYLVFMVNKSEFSFPELERDTPAEREGKRRSGFEEEKRGGAVGRGLSWKRLNRHEELDQPPPEGTSTSQVQ